MLGDIRILFEEMTADAEVVLDVRTLDVFLADGRPAPLLDVVIQSAPAALVPSPPPGPRSRSIPESRPPLPLDPIDLAAPARLPNPTRGRAYYPRSLWPEDQTGHQPVATRLDEWVRAWIAARDRGEHRPQAVVAVLTRWLADRVEWACDEYGVVAEFATEMREIRSVLNGVLGHHDWPTRKDGACPKCDTRDLYVQNGSIWIECGSCDAPLMSPDEYIAWIKGAVERKDEAA